MFNTDDSKNYKEEDKPYKCTGCKTPLGKYDEKCPYCERLNPNYVLR